MSADADHQHVLSDTRNGVLTLTLHNPDRRNAWNPTMEATYFSLLEEADHDAEVRAIVVTGTGDMFCPGMDTQNLSETADTGTLVFAHRRPQTSAHRVRKPMIAAVNGGCAGIGLVQALSCDVRFASTEARFSTAYARRGLPAEYGTSWLLPRLVGVENALDLLLSGRVVGADEAKAMGLVSRVVPPTELLDAAQEYATDLAVHCSPRSMAAIKRQVYGDLSRPFGDAVVQALSLMREFAGSDDFAEGVASFVEKRTPRFPGLDPTSRIDGDLGY